MSADIVHQSRHKICPIRVVKPGFIGRRNCAPKRNEHFYPSRMGLGYQRTDLAVGQILLDDARAIGIAKGDIDVSDLRKV